MTKRKLLYFPEVNPKTFLVFFSKGDSGRSYSFRDYSQGTITLTDAGDYPYTDEEILDKARFSFDVPPHKVKDIAFWQAEVESYNRRFLSSQSLTTAAAHIPSALPLPTQSEAAKAQVPAKYPLLNLDKLSKKNRKRIFTSAQSEDYVTWNVVQLLLRTPESHWMGEFVQLLKRDNPNVTLEYRADDLPTLELWKRLKSPVAYEQSLRQRMAQSGDPSLVKRSQNMRPVEGPSEIDLRISGKRYIIFVEAKLGSDISMYTWNDPSRNQIIRNIDNALEEARERTPIFVMLVKDVEPKRDYVRLLREYQRNPQALFKALNHRKPAEIKPILPNLALVLWKDLIGELENVPTDVGNELQRRIAIG